MIEPDHPWADRYRPDPEPELATLADLRRAIADLGLPAPQPTPEQTEAARLARLRARARTILTSSSNRS